MLASNWYAAALTLLVACSSTGTVPEVSARYETLQGTLAADPHLEDKGKRLFIYLQIDSHNVVVCLARNQERDDILEQLAQLLVQGKDHPVYVYAEKVNGPIEEIVGGIDFEVYAVGVFVPDGQKNRVVLTGYGDSFMGAMKSVKWTDFLQRLLGKGMDAL